MKGYSKLLLIVCVLAAACSIRAQLGSENEQATPAARTPVRTPVGRVIKLKVGDVLELPNGQTITTGANTLMTPGIPIKLITEGGDSHKVAQIALRYAGVPYKWGGSSLRTGVDAGHFVHQVLQQAGIKCPLPPIISQERAGEIVNMKPGITWARRGGKDLKIPPAGDPIYSISNLKCGDRIIIQYSNSDAPRTRHTGIYLGQITFGGRHYAHAVINAASRNGVHIDELDHSWLWKNYKYAVRDNP